MTKKHKQADEILFYLIVSAKLRFCLQGVVVMIFPTQLILHHQSSKKKSF
jgi:hypothetical protein